MRRAEGYPDCRRAAERRIGLHMLNRFPEPFPPRFADGWGDDEHGLWAEFALPTSTKTEPVLQRFRWIEPGTFRMGSSEDEAEREPNEGPRHLVTLTRGVWLADTACTQALWRAVTGSSPILFTDDEQLPIGRVNWNDVQRFLRALEGLLPGCNADLPTEAEWEYACRAGSETPFSFGVQITPEQVNYRGNRPYAGAQEGLLRERTVPVKSLPPNAWGLYEMHGNVWEWCADAPRFYNSASQVDPMGPVTDPSRVVRGGSWLYNAGRARSAYRSAALPGDTVGDQGFRLCLRSIDPAGRGRRPEGVD